MRLTVIARYIGLSLLLVAAFMFASAGVAAANGFDQSFLPLLFSGILTGIMGAFPSIFVRKPKKLSTREGYFIVVGAWVMSCLMGMLPFVLIGGDFTIINSIFESISGFTTTGASIVSDIEALPRGILFWRMSTAWIGGIGILVLFSLIVPSREGRDSILAGSEISDIARSSTDMRSKQFVLSMALTYLALTLLTFVMLMLSGMGPFDAITHAMSACSTCGFSTRNASVAAFSSSAVEIVLIVAMALASIRFVLIAQCFKKGGMKKFFRSQVTVFFLMTLVAGTVVLTLSLLANHAGSLLHCLRMASFQTASIFTTTGFATEDTSVWSPLCRSVIVLGSIACGCSGSTSGGLKCDRLIVAWKMLGRRMRKLHSPNSVQCIMVDGKPMKESAVFAALVFIFTYLAIICVGAIANLIAGMGCTEAWTASIACMGNVGPGMGGVGSMSNYADIPALAKCSSMLLMLLGRLEIYPLLYVLTWRWSRH